MHLFDHAEHAQTVMERLEGRFGASLQAGEPEHVVAAEPVPIRNLGHLA